MYRQKLPKITEENSSMYPNKSRGQILEILTTIERAYIIKNFVSEALGNFKKNTGEFPEQIVIYRDGIGGPTMTSRVQDYEVKVIIDMIENISQTYKP
jgi:predicted Zn-dependent protease with MMP-like domain